MANFSFLVSKRSKRGHGRKTISLVTGGWVALPGLAALTVLKVTGYLDVALSTTYATEILLAVALICLGAILPSALRDETGNRRKASCEES